MSGAWRRSLAMFALLACAGAAEAAEVCGTWTQVAVPGGAGQRLISVSTTGTSNAWTVGSALFRFQPFHWSPAHAEGFGTDPQGYADTTITKVFARSTDDAWMVGWAAFLGSPQTLAQRWNGEQWEVVPSPSIQGGSQFDAVTALSANDAWAVGSRAGGLPLTLATVATLTAHWDGSSWTAVPSPNVSNRHHELNDVVAIAPDDVWAVGASRNFTEDFQTLILHWNGTAWSIVPSPNLPGENLLHGVSAVSANDVWAVGEAWDGVTQRQVFLHWNGSAWSQVTGPGGTTVCAECVGDVLAFGPNDVWAVGGDIGHWDGTQWTVVEPPAIPGSVGFVLRSIARMADCTAWAVGSSYDAEGGEHALSLAYSSTTIIPGLDVDPPSSGTLRLRVGPTPARGDSRIALTLATAQDVRIAVMDASGRMVRELASAALPAGDHVYSWDGTDASGQRTGAGVYFVTVMAGNQRVSSRTLRLH